MENLQPRPPMTSLRTLAAAIVLTASSAVAVSAQGIVPRTLTADEARRDFDTLRQALEEAHGALYRFVPKRELDRRFDAHRKRLDRPVAHTELLGVLREMLVEVGDGHASVDLDDQTVAALAEAPLIPIRTVIEGDRMIIVSNDSPSDTLLRPGMEVTSINGRTPSQILAVLLPKISRDGFIETGRRSRVGRALSNQFHLFVDQSPTYVITAADAAGRSVSVTLPGVTDAARAKNVNPVNDPYRAAFARIDAPVENISLRSVGDGIAVLRVRGFGGERFPSQLDSVVVAAVDAGTRAMILDLRGNGGGVDDFGALLVSKFRSSPFRYFDHIHLTTIRPSFATWKPSTFDDTRDGTVPDPRGGYLVTTRLHPGVGELQPAPKPFLGPLVVLMDGATFSTAADVTAALRSQGRATFIGEETGGAYEGNTSGLNAQIVLPASGFKSKIQMYGYVNAVKPAPNGRGTIPDHVVPRTTSDILRGVDEGIAKAVEILTGAKPPSR
jgi:hypothetical protein